MVTPDSELPNELPSSAQLYQMICGIRITQSISVAARLGIADLLKDGQKPVEELADATGTDTPSLYRVMRALASLGIFVETDPQHFDLAPLAQLLLTDSPDSLRDFAIMMGSEMLSNAWSNLMYTVQTGVELDVPLKAAQDWVYRGVASPANQRKLDEFLPCPHHWVIDAANGRTSRGICQLFQS